MTDKTWYVYDNEGNNVAVLNCWDINEAYKEARRRNLGDVSIERA